MVVPQNELKKIVPITVYLYLTKKNTKLVFNVNFRKSQPVGVKFKYLAIF